jgi:hypothetical protein
MRAILPFSFLLFVMMCVGALRASEVTGVALRTFRVESFDSTDPIIISGTQNNQGLTSLHIRAFHKSLKLTKAQLKLLRHLHVNGVQVDFEGGWGPKYGGSSVYITLFGTSDEQSSESAGIDVHEGGQIEVSKPH